MLSERIYQFRRKSGLSQEQLAEKIGVSRQAISKWESGTSMPEFQKLLALSECFHITLDELVKDRGAEERTEETRSTPKEAKGPKAMDQKAGICLCLAGAICLTLIRTHDGHKPRCGRAAEYRFNDHPQWVWCAHRPVRPFDGHWSGPDPAKEMNGGKPMWKLSHLFSAVAILLSDVMCAVVAFGYRDMLCGIEHSCYSAPASVAFLYAIPFGIGIAVCSLVAYILHKRSS